MRKFRLKNIESVHSLKRLMWRSSENGMLDKKTIREVYIRRPVFSFERLFSFFKEQVLPRSVTVYVIVGIAVILTVMLLNTCSMRADLILLEKQNRALLSSNYNLENNVESLNSTIAQNKDLARLQQQTILNQKDSISEIEKTVSEIESKAAADIENAVSEKDEILNDLIDMIKKYDIFSGVLSRSSDLYSATSQIADAKQDIISILGDTPEADGILQRLDEEAIKLTSYADRIPDYTPTVGSLTSPYGYRNDPFTGALKFHKGIDIANSKGTAIKASASGTVVAAYYESSYGYMILLDHGNGYQTRYAHLSKILVKTGEFVSKGSTIGQMGSSGRATGSHLHFEVILNGSTQNPLKYVTLY